eukprot:m.239317 g.239317  ORF g.239317 m.239317 type:complete len:947 (+) comp18977_c2_seq1:474-3314(+)
MGGNDNNDGSSEGGCHGCIKRLVRRYCNAVVNNSVKGMVIGILVALFIAAIALVAYPIEVDTGGSSLTPRNSRVGRLQDALFVGEEETVFNPGPGVTATFPAQQLLSSDELILMLWDSSENNVLTDNGIDFLRKIEQEIVQHQDYDSVCYQSTNGTCLPPDSLLQYLYAEPNPGCATFNPNGLNTVRPRAIDDVLLSLIDPDAAPIYCQPNNGSGCFASCLEPTENFINAAVSPGFGYEGDDKDPGDVPNLDSYTTKLIIRFGLPLPGFTSPRDRADEQEKKIDDFIESFSSVLSDNRDVSGKPALRYSAAVLNDEHISSIIFGDSVLITASIVVVFLYMWFHLQSAFLAGFGMLHIILSFPMAYLIVQITTDMGGTGLLTFMTLFIILGIGADDVFIFVDAWKQSEFAVERPSTDERSGPEYNDWLQRRLDWAYRRSAKAMIITSATTSAAFILNLTSSIPAIQLFGLVTAIMVIANYVLVVTYYPCVTLVWERYIKFRSCCCKNAVSPCRSGKKESEDYVGPSRGKVTLPNASGDGGEDAASAKQPRQSRTDIQNYRPLERFFHNWYSINVYEKRYYILAAFAIFVAVSIAFAAQLSAADEPTKFLPSDDYLQQSQEVSTEDFKRSGVVAQVRYVHGLLGVQGSNPFNSQDLGSPRFDPDFDVSSPAAQQAYLDMCSRLVTDAPSILNAEVLCPMQEFRDWLVDVDGKTFPVAQTDFYDSLSNFTTYYELTNGQTKIYTASSEDRDSRDFASIGLDRAIRWIENDDGSFSLAYLATIVNITLNIQQPASQIEPVFDAWEDYLTTDQARADMQVTQRCARTKNRLSRTYPDGPLCAVLTPTFSRHPGPRIPTLAVVGAHGAGTDPQNSCCRRYRRVPSHCLCRHRREHPRLFIVAPRHHEHRLHRRKFGCCCSMAGLDIGFGGFHLHDGARRPECGLCHARGPCI